MIEHCAGPELFCHALVTDKTPELAGGIACGEGTRFTVMRRLWVGTVLEVKVELFADGHVRVDGERHLRPDAGPVARHHRNVGPTYPATRSSTATKTEEGTP